MQRNELVKMGPREKVLELLLRYATGLVIGDKVLTSRTKTSCMDTYSKMQSEYTVTSLLHSF